MKKPTFERILRRGLSIGASRELMEPTRRLALVQYDRGLAWHPSGHAKRKHLGKLFNDRRHDVFIESGTYLGDTVAYIEPRARLVISVELDEVLYERAQRRFAGNDKIKLHHGDGAEAVPLIVEELEAPAMIWLDGHYSMEGTALGDEHEPALTLLTKLGPVITAGTTIVVDDLRLFSTHSEFPTLDELLAVARRTFPRARIRTGMDSLVIEA